jgi:hypothetical protein
MVVSKQGDRHVAQQASPLSARHRKKAQSSTARAPEDDGPINGESVMKYLVRQFIHELVRQLVERLFDHPELINDIIGWLHRLAENLQ